MKFPGGALSRNQLLMAPSVIFLCLHPTHCRLLHTGVLIDVWKGGEREAFSLTNGPIEIKYRAGRGLASSLIFCGLWHEGFSTYLTVG